jgi:crossover junction endodeoxyribonuclease RusA
MTPTPHDLIDEIIYLCEWVRSRTEYASSDEHDRLHAAHHLGEPCPYQVVAAHILGEPDPRDLVAEWRIDLDPILDAKGRAPLSLNDRVHWAAHAAKVSRIKAGTRNAVMAAGVPHLAHVHVELHYRPKTNRYRDVDNLVATLKPAIDGLHQRDESVNVPVPYEPIVDGDDPRFVTWSPPVLHPAVKAQPSSLWLVLRSYALYAVRPGGVS